jgi:hypothetical protein
MNNRHEEACRGDCGASSGPSSATKEAGDVWHQENRRDRRPGNIAIVHKTVSITINWFLCTLAASENRCVMRKMKRSLVERICPPGAFPLELFVSEGVQEPFHVGMDMLRYPLLRYEVQKLKYTIPIVPTANKTISP